MCGWCDHYFLSALGFPKFSELLDAPGFPLAVFANDKSHRHFLFMEHVTSSSLKILILPLLFLHPLRHLFWATYQAGILSAASRAEMAAVEYMKKIVPFATCEITCGQNVCELMFGINVSNLNFRIKINPVKQPIQSYSVGPWYMSHCGTSAHDYHLNHGFIILRDIQHSIGTRMCHAWWNVINVGQIEISVHGGKLFPHVWMSVCRQVS